MDLQWSKQQIAGGCKMRSTYNIDDDVLAAARELAKFQRKSVGAVISSLVRKALYPTEPAVSTPEQISQPPGEAP